MLGLGKVIGYTKSYNKISGQMRYDDVDVLDILAFGQILAAMVHENS